MIEAMYYEAVFMSSGDDLATHACVLLKYVLCWAEDLENDCGCCVQRTQRRNIMGISCTEDAEMCHSRRAFVFPWIEFSGCLGELEMDVIGQGLKHGAWEEWTFFWMMLL